ncbi:MAG: hypothetical protein U1E60_27040 [Reyranellaceae bacterium]
MKAIDHRVWCVVVVGLLGAPSLPAGAQPAAIEWTAVSKLVSGNCSDGTRAQMVERDGKIVMKTSVLGRVVDTFTIPIEANGSGRAAYQAAPHGRQLFEVAAGKGKRPLRQSQMDGPCQWSYVPQ